MSRMKCPLIFYCAQFCEAREKLGELYRPIVFFRRSARGEIGVATRGNGKKKGSFCRGGTRGDASLLSLLCIKPCAGSVSGRIVGRFQFHVKLSFARTWQVQGEHSRRAHSSFSFSFSSSSYEGSAHAHVCMMHMDRAGSSRRGGERVIESVK